MPSEPRDLDKLVVGSEWFRNCSLEMVAATFWRLLLTIVSRWQLHLSLLLMAE